MGVKRHCYDDDYLRSPVGRLDLVAVIHADHLARDSGRFLRGKQHGHRPELFWLKDPMLQDLGLGHRFRASGVDAPRYGEQIAVEETLQIGKVNAVILQS